MRKRAIPAVSEQTSTRSVEDFGSNEWLVEELYEQYQADKNSVDKSWWPFFEKFENGDGSVDSGSGGGSKPSAQTPSEKKSQKKSGDDVSAHQDTGAAKDAPAKERKTSSTDQKGVTPSVTESETQKAESKSAAAARKR